MGDFTSDRERSASRWVWAVVVVPLVACDAQLGGEVGGEEGELSTVEAVEGAPTCDGEIGAAAPLRRLTPLEYANSVADVFSGAATDTSRAPTSQTGISTSGFSTDPDLNAVTLQAAGQFEQAAEDTAVLVAESLSTLLPCAATSPDAACVETFIDTYARRAFRRPPTAEERTRLQALFALGSDASFAVGIASLTAGMLQMPAFLYLPEIGPTDAPTEDFDLTSYEKAARVSYLLWQTTPDDALLAAAERGELDTDEGLEREVERLASSPQARTAVARFWREMLHVDVLDESAKSAEAFPLWTAEVAAAQNEQFDRFVGDLTLDTPATVTDLLTTNQVPYDERLAAWYTGAEVEQSQVTDPTGRLSGLLTLPAVLSSHAHPAGTSVVFRGHFVRTSLLCEDLPPPPPDALDRLPEIPPGTTERQKSEIIRGIAECGGCHALMDPVGLGLEEWSAVGMYAPVDESGAAIDASGEVVGLGESDGQFTGARELGLLLAGSGQVEECLTRSLFRYALSRRESADDECALEGLRAAPSDSLRSNFLAFFRSSAFGRRQLSEPSP